MTPASVLVRRFACLSLAVAAVAVGGCDTAADLANRAAADKMAEAEAQLAQNQFDQALASSTDAASMSDVSPALAARAHALQAQLRVAKARDLMDGAADAELNVNRLCGSIRLSVAQVTAAQGQIKSDQAYDPAPIIEQLKARIAAAQGSDGHDTWPGPDLTVPAPEPVAVAAPAAAEPVAPPAPAKPQANLANLMGLLSGKVPPPAAAQPAPAAVPAPPVPQFTASQPLPPVKPEDMATLGTIHGLDAQIAQLQSKIADNRAHAQKLVSQKAAAIGQADQLQQKSLGEPGDQSVEDVKTAAEGRRSAADLGIEMDGLDNTLVNLQADLKLAQSQRVAVQKAIDGFQAQIADLTVAWTSVQQNIDAEKGAMARIVGPAAPAPAAAAPGGDASVPAPPPLDASLPAPPPQPQTIADECAELKVQLAIVRDGRDKAVTELKEAVTGFNAASRAGDQFRTDSTPIMQSDRVPPGEKTALAELQETYAGASARLSMADAERMLAINYSGEAMVANQIKQSLSLAQGALGSDAPAALADCLTAAGTPSIDDLAALAEERFKDAMDHYQNQIDTQAIPGRGGDVRKTAAMAGNMITAYGAKQLSLALGGKPINGQTPADLQTTIDGIANDLSARDAGALPPIPYTIAPPATAPSPQ